MNEKSNSLYEMAAYVDMLEKKLDSMSQELNNVSQSILEMNEKQLANKIKKAVIQVIDTSKANIAIMKAKVSEVKADIRTKAISIVNDVKAKGKSALNRIAEFTGLKWKLKAIDDKIQVEIKNTEHTIEKLDNFTTSMRNANTQFANSFRLLAGKAEVKDTEPDKKGFIARSIIDQWKWQKKVYEGMSKNVKGMISRLDNLSMEMKEKERDTNNDKNNEISEVNEKTEKSIDDVIENELMTYDDIEIIDPDDWLLKVAEDDRGKEQYMPVATGKSR